MPRTTTFFGAVPVMMNPAIEMSSPVCTTDRVEMLRRRARGAAAASGVFRLAVVVWRNGGLLGAGETSGVV